VTSKTKGIIISVMSWIHRVLTIRTQKNGAYPKHNPYGSLQVLKERFQKTASKNAQDIFLITSFCPLQWKFVTFIRHSRAEL